MKSFLKLFILLGIVAFAGCRNLGYNDQSANNSMTPGSSQKEYVRTYDANGNPVVAPVTPANSDPASPGYSK